MRMCMCHDYLPEGGRHDYIWETTIGEQKRSNLHVREGIGANEFIYMREKRDATLPIPRLMIPALQVNVRAGRVPEEGGQPMLRVPINSVFSRYAKQ